MAKKEMKIKSVSRAQLASKTSVAKVAKTNDRAAIARKGIEAKPKLNGKKLADQKPIAKVTGKTPGKNAVQKTGMKNVAKPAGKVAAKTLPQSVVKKPVRVIPRVQMTADVLVMGEHPAAYLCAALLHDVAKVKVIHSAIPGEPVVDRLCHLNPEFFGLAKMLEPLRRKLEMDTIYGVQFLGADAATRSEHRSKSITGYIVSYKAFRNAMIEIAKEVGVQFLSPETLDIQRLDETGVDLSMGNIHMRTRMMITAGMPTIAQQKMLGMPENWGADVVRRFSILKIKGTKSTDLGSRPVMPMSLNVAEQLCWGWLMPASNCIQLMVEQPVESLGKISQRQVMSSWIDTLRMHDILKSTGDLKLADMYHLDIPITGALVHEGVANRTLLIGPAAGFYSATGEDLYPNCWSSVFAVDAAVAALKERFLQDALQPYRHQWRTTLGDYMRGPQQNLRFLLPLVYRNEVMTQRLTESILAGKSLVR